MNQNLADIFKNKQAAASDGAKIDWDARRDEYRKAVNGLFKQIEILLEEPISKGWAALQRRAKELSENYIGTYTVDDLVLVVGDEQIRFSPRGRNIVGASGRVDVLGEHGEEILVVQDDRWSFVQTRQPTLKLVAFDESSLADLLKRVMRGTNADADCST